MTEPVDCILWDKPELVLEGTVKDRFERIDTFVQESHWWRYLLRCRECGQLYFFEFSEEVDWEHGNDPQYTTYIPVETIEEGEALSKQTSMELLNRHPRLQKDFPKSAAKPAVRWVR